jgi:hypothetical protein
VIQGGYLDGMMGPTLAVPKQGYGGWVDQNRKRRRTAVRWDGSPPVIIPLDVVFGSRSPRARKTDSIELEIRKLEIMAGLSGDGDEPPILQFAANAPHDYNHAPQNLWIIDNLEWSDDDNFYKKNDDGEFTLARIIADLKLWTPTSYAALDAPAAARKKKTASKKSERGDSKKASKDYHTVQPGETLSGIAAKELGSSSRWPELAKLNKLRDPDDIKVGQKIRLR